MSATEHSLIDPLHVGVDSTAHGAHAQSGALTRIATRLADDFGALTSALGGLLPRFKQAALALDYGSAVLLFPTHHEFDFALSTRIETPLSRIVELDQLTLFELRRMATDIRKLEHRYSEVLTTSMERGLSLRSLMSHLDVKSFSNDYEWRSIFAALADSADDRHDPFRKVALAKYMQYLRNRQATIQKIYSERESTPEPPARDSADAIAATRLHETAIFDFTDSRANSDVEQDLWLLPRGESIGITVAGDTAFELLLATYEFSLHCCDGLHLLDLETSAHYTLRPGRNTLGRDQTCDVVVDLKHREISRKHLVIDVIDEHTAVFTDLSSHGTRVPASRVIGVRPTEPAYTTFAPVGAGPAPSV